MKLIDLDQLLKYPLRRESALCDEEHADPHFLNGVESVLEWAQTLPTLTPPNEWVSVYDRLRELVQADREGRCVVIRPNSVTDDNYKIICKTINAEDIHLGKMRNAYEKHK